MQRLLAGRAAAFHVNADVAAAAIRHARWTGDADFDRTYALPILVETARLWHGLGYFGDDGGFHLDGVTGPDEYSALADDNTYTNLMAAANLRDAAAAARRWSAEAAERGVEADEIERWHAAAKAMAVPYNVDGMPEQDRGSTRREVWDSRHRRPTTLSTGRERALLRPLPQAGGQAS